MKILENETKKNGGDIGGVAKNGRSGEQENSPGMRKGKGKVIRKGRLGNSLPTAQDSPRDRNVFCFWLFPQPSLTNLITLHLRLQFEKQMETPHTLLPMHITLEDFQ